MRVRMSRANNFWVKRNVRGLVNCRSGPGLEGNIYEFCDENHIAVTLPTKQTEELVGINTGCSV
jgi:hypothetical protein